jgi:hypothetical protein
VHHSIAHFFIGSIQRGSIHHTVDGWLRLVGQVPVMRLLYVCFDYLSAYNWCRYVCCAAELKRCEAKVLALQCSVDDLVRENLSVRSVLYH